LDNPVAQGVGRPCKRLAERFGQLRCIPVANVGRESYAYLYHVSQNYDTLADKMVFAQARPPTPGYFYLVHEGGHMMPDGDFFYDFLSPFTSPRVVPTCWRTADMREIAMRRGYDLPDTPKTVENHTLPEICPNEGRRGWNVWNDTSNPWLGKVEEQPGEEATTLDYWGRYLERDLGKFRSRGFMFSNGAVFSASAPALRKLSLSTYRALLGTVDHHVDPVAGYHLEQLWGYIGGHGDVLDRCSAAMDAWH